MPPKKTKGRKRSSTDDKSDDSDKAKPKGDSSGEHTDLLSPSEVVKMRKKTRPATQSGSPTPNTNPKETSKEKDSTRTATKVVKSNRVMERNNRKELEKKKELAKPKKEKGEKENENKRTRVMKEKKHLVKKKPKTEVEVEEDLENDSPASILYPCGICTKEVSDADDAILCEAGCEYWYHRNCTGMTDIAYQLLTNEDNAEWVCDKCIATKSVPLTKLKGE